MNSGVENVNVMPLGKYVFTKNQGSESQTSMKGVNSAQEMFTEILRLRAFVYTVTTEAILYSRTYMDLSVPSTIQVRRGWNSVYEIRTEFYWQPLSSMEICDGMAKIFLL